MYAREEQNTDIRVPPRAAVQGMGSGVILALTEIILADLVPLRERGAYQGAIGLIWSIASIIGPLVVRPIAYWSPLETGSLTEC